MTRGKNLSDIAGEITEADEVPVPLMAESRINTYQQLSARFVPPAGGSMFLELDQCFR